MRNSSNRKDKILKLYFFFATTFFRISCIFIIEKVVRALFRDILKTLSIYSNSPDIFKALTRIFDGNLIYTISFECLMYRTSCIIKQSNYFSAYIEHFSLLSYCNFIKKEILAQVFSCEFFEILINL